MPIKPVMFQNWMLTANLFGFFASFKHCLLPQMINLPKCTTTPVQDLMESRSWQAASSKLLFNSEVYNRLNQSSAFVPDINIFTFSFLQRWTFSFALSSQILLSQRFFEAGWIVIYMKIHYKHQILYKVQYCNWKLVLRALLEITRLVKKKITTLL